MSRSDARICAIHQPNFFPWLGYFDKIVRADIFVLLDDVQYQKTGGNWTNRVQMMIGQGPKWVTAPVDRSYSGVRQIREIRFSPVEREWREKLCSTITASYGRAAYFREVYPFIEPIIMNESDFLSDYSSHAIAALCDYLEIESSKLVRSSQFNLQNNATDLLIDITKAVGAVRYLCGGGAQGYQEDEKFPRHGIQLIYQNFCHPIYTQANDAPFQPGLSIVDALMHCGRRGVIELLNRK